MKEVEGKVAFITGGASGLGLSMARAFTAAGMKVAIADIQQDALDIVLKEFAASNAEVIGIKLDVTDRDAMEAAADKVEKELGNIHLVCNNAGVAVGGSITEMSYTDWDWVMRVNVDGVVNGMQTFLPRLLAHGEGGHIVNTGSIAGHLPVAGLSVYNTGKFAVVGMSEAVKQDLANTNVGISVLCPGIVNTNIFDSGRNRPEQLQSSTDTASKLLDADKQGTDKTNDNIEAVFENVLDPSVIGDMVLHAVQSDEFYIFSHPEFRKPLEARAAEISASMERWADYRNTNNI
ncbi:MAG: SDR family NAD(P)-dependent oxidoreductase [Pseudomonadales bacterium]|nr:SDR family NAD(P)-dependent oxidoreductase [Pseudomonadales bacterium]